MADIFIKDNKMIEVGKGSVIVGDVRVFNPSAEVLRAAGWTPRPEFKRPLEMLIKSSDEKINRETDRKILNEFTWNGEQFYLTMENQFNFKNLYDLRDMREYPVLIKTKNGFMQLDNAEEVAEFYLAGVNFVDQCLKEGWVKKAEAADKIEKEYNAAKNKATETVEE